MDLEWEAAGGSGGYGSGGYGYGSGFGSGGTGGTSGIMDMIMSMFGGSITDILNMFGIGNSNGTQQAGSGIMSLIKTLISFIFGEDVLEDADGLYEKIMEELEKQMESGIFDRDALHQIIIKAQDPDARVELIEMLNLTELFAGMQDMDVKGLLDMLMNAVKSFFGMGGSSSLPEVTETLTMNSSTAKDFAGEDYNVELSAKVYKNGNSTKWALVIHPFLLNGKTMANAVGPYYYDAGYNIIAPDLRGFGDSDGSVALGCLESMDIYDWLVELNKEYEVSEVIVHGTSLGAATTNFLSGIDKFIKPEDISTPLKSLKDLKVVGLVEDCGYMRMTDFAPEVFLTTLLKIGLEDKDFAHYSNAENSLENCELPMLIIHGTSDMMVDPENATEIKAIVKDSEYVEIKGGAHALIIMGNNEQYENGVKSFIKKVQMSESKEDKDSGVVESGQSQKNNSTVNNGVQNEPNKNNNENQSNDKPTNNNWWNRGNNEDYQTPGQIPSWPSYRK